MNRVSPSRRREDPGFAGTERFCVQERLGEGGMGVVYRARDRERGGEVALKLLRRVDPTALLRFKREFRALADVTHPNLVTLYELAADGDDWFVTMELVEGVDFSRHVRGQAGAGDASWYSPTPLGREASTTVVASATGPRATWLEGGAAAARTATLGTCPLGPAELARLRAALPQLVRAIDAVHRAGHLHRDVKPSNVRVDASGRVVLLDFGIVLERERARAGDERGPVVGTPAYMAPEQAAGDALSEAADWYALGVILFELLVGGPPFGGDASAILAAKQRFDAPQLSSGRLAGAPAELAALCDRLLSRDPAARPGAAEILATLGEDAAPAELEAEPALIGRDRELEILARALAATRAGAVRAVFVSGASGSGKTALCRAFLDGLPAGAAVLAGRCFQRESVPYKAIDPLVDALAAQLAGADAELAARLAPLARLFPVLGRLAGDAPAGPEPADPLERRRRAFRALRAVWRELAAARPLVVWIDDLQWADADSAALLAEILAPPDAPDLLLIATARAGAGDPVRAPLRELLPADAIVDVSLEPLPAADARALAAACLPAGVRRAELAAAIAAESDGSPYLIRELCGLPADSAGDRDRERNLDRLLAARVADLGAESRRLLEIIAVAGAPVRQDTAGAAAGIAAGAHHIVSLGNLRLVRTAGAAAADRVESYHDRIREVVVAALAPDDLRARHRALAETLERRDEADPETLAAHFDAAGVRDRAAAYAVRAAAIAERALAFDRAAALYERALSSGHYGGDDARSLRLRHAEALANAGRGKAAAASFRLAAQGADPTTRLRCERRAAEHLLMSGQIEQGLAAVDTVLSQFGHRLPSRPTAALAALAISRARVALGRRPRRAAPQRRFAELETFRAVGHGLAVVDPIRGADFQARYLLCAQASGAREHLAPALAAEACFLAAQGGRRARRAARLAAEVERLAAGDAYLEAWAHTAAGFVAYFDVRYADAAAALALADERFSAKATGTAWELGTVRLFRLWSLLHLGALADVAAAHAGIVASARDRGDRYIETTAQRSCHLVYLAAGDPERARRELDGATWPAPPGAFHLQHWFELRARAEIALYEGSAAEAAPWLAPRFSALDRSLLTRFGISRAEAAWLRARLALAAGAPDALATARRAARRLRAQPHAHARVWGAFLDAELAARRGDRAAAAQRLADAAARADAATMHAAAAIARRAAAQLGGRPCAAADDWFSRERIADPQRFSSVWMPHLKETS